MTRATILGGIRFAPSLPDLALESEAAPASGVRPDLALVAHRRVLLASKRHDDLARLLERRGAEVIRVASTDEAARTLANNPIDLFAIDPELAAALDFVRDLKLAKQPPQGSEVWMARALQPLLPVLILPMKGDHQYAVIVRAPNNAYLEQDTRVPLVRAIMALDMRRLLGERGDLV